MTRTNFKSLAMLQVIALACAFVSTAAAETYYVNWDGSAQFTTIQAAVDYASPGDTVFVFAGTYNENLVISQQLTLTGADRYTTIVDGGGVGDVVQVQASGVTIRELTLTDSGTYYNQIGSPDCGIDIMLANYCEVSVCILSANTVGLAFASACNSLLTECTVEDNTYGVMFTSHNMVGFSQHDEIAHNLIQSNYSGIVMRHEMDHHYQNYIHHNEIRDNSWGIGMIMAEQNEIAYNDIIANAQYGISISVCMACGSGNVFHHNNFINNHGGGVQAYDMNESLCGDNYWYSSATQQGNYWSDYMGADPNHDGIGSAPYDIDTEYEEHAQDLYPLMHPFRLGDMNCDAVVNGYDIDPFVLALTDPVAYQGQYHLLATLHGDIDGDGAVNGYDIDPFVELLVAP